MPVREGNNPKRRIAAPERLDLAGRQALAARIVYVGSAHHKTKPGDYGLMPPANPRGHKSLCDGVRTVLLAEAQRLLRDAVLKGMFSDFADDGLPKYVWSVDEDGLVFEAKIGLGGYHGYCLENDDQMRRVVLREWSKR